MENTTEACTTIGAGLKNIGQTCYINVVIQCLSYTPEFQEYCSSGAHTQKCDKFPDCLLCALTKHISVAIQSHGQTITPVEVLQHIYSSGMFEEKRQEDSQELLLYILNKMYDSNPTETKVFFGGVIKNKINCQRCDNSNTSLEPFFGLNVQIKGVTSVTEGLTNLFQTEILKASNAFYCQRCELEVEASKNMEITISPTTLFIQLNRFTAENGVLSKVVTFTEFPSEINLASFMTKPTDEATEYKLYGIVVHHGNTMYYGHYTAFVKVKNSWFHLDDSKNKQAEFSGPSPNPLGPRRVSDLLVHVGSQGDSDILVCPDSNDTKSGETAIPVKCQTSFLYQLASRFNISVRFEVIQEEGPPHLRNFITQCTFLDLITHGDGKTKKSSKANSAKLMIGKLCKVHPELIIKPKTKTQQKAGKNRNLIKLKLEQELTECVHPIDVLEQVLKAQKRMLPNYTLISERANEFIIQIQVEDKLCAGTGRSIHLAKKGAAVCMLHILGYMKPRHPASGETANEAHQG